MVDDTNKDVFEALNLPVNSWEHSHTVQLASFLLKEVDLHLIDWDSHKPCLKVFHSDPFESGGIQWRMLFLSEGLGLHNGDPVASFYLERVCCFSQDEEEENVYAQFALEISHSRGNFTRVTHHLFTKREPVQGFFRFCDPKDLDPIITEHDTTLHASVRVLVDSSSTENGRDRLSGHFGEISKRLTGFVGLKSSHPSALGSVVQMLFFVVPFRKVVLKAIANPKPRTVLSELQSVFSHMEDGAEAVDMTYLQESLSLPSLTSSPLSKSNNNDIHSVYHALLQRVVSALEV